MEDFIEVLYFTMAPFSVPTGTDPKAKTVVAMDVSHFKGKHDEEFDFDANGEVEDSNLTLIPWAQAECPRRKALRVEALDIRRGSAARPKSVQP